ncbi:MAG: hypothetical protein ACU0B1_10545 [Thermohalobaculum sp.]
MTPSEAILSESRQVTEITDGAGRRLRIRRLTALDRLRLYKAIGDRLSANDAYFGIAFLAASVTELDDVPFPWPVNETQVEAAVGRLGDAGLDAVAGALDDMADRVAAATGVVAAGKPSGTLS